MREEGGRVGEGKSSLVSAFLGKMEKISGRVNVKVRRGRREEGRGGRRKEGREGGGRDGEDKWTSEREGKKGKEGGREGREEEGGRRGREG